MSTHRQKQYIATLKSMSQQQLIDHVLRLEANQNAIAITHRAELEKAHDRGAAMMNHLHIDLGYPFKDALAEHMMTIVAITTSILSTGSQDAIRESIRDADQLLAEYMTKLSLRARATNMNITEIASVTGALIGAIQDYLTGRCDLQALRTAAIPASSERYKEMLAYLEDIDLGGRPPGMSEWRADLAMQALQLRNEGLNAGEIRQTLLEHLSKPVTDKDTGKEYRVERDDLTENQGKQYGVLSGLSGTNVRKYISKLIKEYEQMSL